MLNFLLTPRRSMYLRRAGACLHYFKHSFLSNRCHVYWDVLVQATPLGGSGRALASRWKTRISFFATPWLFLLEKMLVLVLIQQQDHACHLCCSSSLLIDM